MLPERGAFLLRMSNKQNQIPTVKKFKPTRNMIRWLQESIKLGHSASIVKIAKEVGINRRNWYFWLKKRVLQNSGINRHETFK